MSDDIEFNVAKGTSSMFSVKQVPWHKLGQVVDKALTTKEAIEAANLDYKVKKIQNTMEYEGIKYVSPGSFSTFRPDTKKVLGSVGKDYTIIQNKDAFVFFDSIVGKGQAIFETAGVLGNGERIFITAKLPKSIVIADIDKVDQYLLFTNTHDGSRSIEVLFTPIRVVCNNTLTAALTYAKNRIKIRHTSSANDRLKEAHKLLGIHTELYDEQEQYFNMLAETKINAEQFKTYVCNIFLTKAELLEVAMVGFNNMGELAPKKISQRKLNILDNVGKYYIGGPGQRLATADDTMWGAYNAITGYYHNFKDYNEDNQKKVNSNFYGTNYNSMHSAYKLAVAMANNEVPILTDTGNNKTLN